MDDGCSRIITRMQAFMFSSARAVLLYVTKQGCPSFVPVLAWKERCCGRVQGWPVPTTAFPQPSRFHRNKTTRPQQPRLTCCTVLHLQKPLASATAYLSTTHLSFSRSVQQSIHRRLTHCTVYLVDKHPTSNARRDTREQQQDQAAEAEAHFLSVLIESARRPTLAGLPANTSQSPLMCQHSRSTPTFQ